MQRKRDDTIPDTERKRFVTDKSTMSDKELFMQECDEITPSDFLKEVMYEQEGVVKSEALNISKQAAIKADNYARLAKLNGENRMRNEWYNLGWELRKAK